MRVAVSETVSLALATHTATFASRGIPAKALAATRLSLLDAVGVSLAASGLSDECAIFKRSVASPGSAGNCTVLGWGDRVPLLTAALTNGALAHAIDFEDVFDQSPIHPNACTIAAALSVAQEVGTVTGADLLGAIAIGCDLVCRLSLALSDDPGKLGWYVPPILGAYGATAAAGRLLKLDSLQMLNAFALTLSQVTCPGQFKQTPGSSIRAIRDSFATHAGVLAATLAKGGLCGFSQPFEGSAGLYQLYANGRFDADVLVNGLGDRFYGEDVSFKLWPACRGTHAFIEAALQLRSEVAFRAEAVGEILAEGAAFLAFLAEPHAAKSAPTVSIDAKFSIPFAAATALVHGDPTLSHFQSESLADPAVRDLASRFRFRPCSSYGNDANSGALTITFSDSSPPLHARIDAAFGHPTHPVSQSMLLAKFRQCAEMAACPPGEDALARFIDAVLNLGDEGDQPASGSFILDHLYLLTALETDHG